MATRPSVYGKLFGSQQVYGREGFESFASGKTIEEVEIAIAEDVFDPRTKAIAETWVRQRREQEAAERAHAGLDLERRAVEASERAAKAAELSAEAAKKSARISLVALLVAAVAALVAAWPMIKDVGRPVEARRVSAP